MSCGNQVRRLSNMNENNFTHIEAVKFVKTLLASYGITEYGFYEKSYDVDNEYYYGSKSHHDYTRFSELPAPYNIGNTMIEVYDAHISIRLVMLKHKLLSPEEKELYKTDIMIMKDDIWVIDIPNNKMLSDRWSDYKSGYNFGLPVNEKTILEFYKLFKIIYGTDYKTNIIIKLAVDSYINERDINNFMMTAAFAWYKNDELWSCINQFSTQWGEISKIWLVNNYHLEYK